MRRATGITIFLLITAFHATEEAVAQAVKIAAWTTVFDGKSLSAFNVIGDANWQLMEGVVQANKGSGFLVTKTSYADFEIKVEFWVDDDGNSGVFLRCENPQQIGSNNAYEVNINDKRADPSYGTGGIPPNIAKASPMLKSGGKWNTFEITAQGPHLVVILNGTKTVDVQDSSHHQGRIALQYNGGTVRFRSVQIRPL